jgi:DNA-binding response OmpR family regulator/DNA-binding CsgD family transcriptional regulator
VIARILIIDDDSDTCTMLREFAVAEGYEAETANSGEAALARLDAIAPDIILLDAVMAGLDGFETCRQIKQRDGTAHVPVIFMTGLCETAHVVKGLEAGGVDYVTKPLALDVLAARIRVHLGNALATRSALSALGSTGGRLICCNDSGRIAWSTPEASRLVDELDAAAAEDLRRMLQQMAIGDVDKARTFDCGGQRFRLAFLGRTAPEEYLFRLFRTIEGVEPQVLRQAFGLTPREADVLLWTARGKSNKDMGEILNISARTVNKHLEQIFIKIGVENRASAASAAARVLYAPT